MGADVGGGIGGVSVDGQGVEARQVFISVPLGVAAFVSPVEGGRPDIGVCSRACGKDLEPQRGAGRERLATRAELCYDATGRIEPRCCNHVGAFEYVGGAYPVHVDGASPQNNFDWIWAEFEDIQLDVLLEVFDAVVSMSAYVCSLTDVPEESTNES